VVHVRQVEDKTLTFIVSGKLWRNSLIMQDKETGSLWSHVTGVCLEGEYKGTQLEMIPVVQTTWSQWVADHPETRVLKKSEEIKSAPYQRYFDDPEKTGLFSTVWLQDRLPGKSLIHGVMLGTHSLAVADAALAAGASVTGKLGDVEVKVTRGADGGVSAVRSDTGEELVVRTAYWFAWSTYFPKTEVID
jgi:hypothetical protein